MFTDAEAEDVALVAVAAIDAPAEAWTRFDAKARREETTYQRAALQLFTKERREVAARIVESVPSAYKARDPDPSISDPYIAAVLIRIAADYAPGGEYHRAWLERYRGLIGQTVRVGGRDVASQVGLSFSLDNPRARAAVQRRVTRLTGNVTQTTIDRIRDVIRTAQQEGVGVSQIARRIRDDAFSGEVTTARARTIARTESVGALNEGQFLGATEQGVMQSKRWLSQRDGRVRDTHEAAASEGWIALPAPFSNGLHYPHEPGAPADEVVQCRCTLQYSDLPPAEANARQR